MASLAADDNGSLALPTSTHLYRFHWIHTPRLLTGKADEAFSSTIRVVGSVPGDFPISVWVTAADCGMCQPVARSLLVLPITGEDLPSSLICLQALGAEKTTSLAQASQPSHMGRLDPWFSVAIS